MNISGPNSIPSRYEDPTINLRLQGRFGAEVLAIAGDRVTLSVGGVAIVARLTSAEQAAILTQQRRALFQVQDSSGPELRVKLLKTAPEASGDLLSLGDDPVAGLIQLADLPDDEISAALVRAFLRRNQPISKEWIDHLRSCLKSALPAAGSDAGAERAGAPGAAGLSSAAQIAVNWTAAGRALTPAILQLLLQDLPNAAALMARLRTALQTSQNSRGHSHLKGEIQTALDFLDALALELPPADDFIEQLKQTTAQLARGVHPDLAEPEKGQAPDLPAGLIGLAALRRNLHPGEHQGLAQAIDGFFDQLSLQRLYNVAAGASPEQERWIQLELPCRLPSETGNTQNEFTPVKLRVLKDPQLKNPPGRLDNARLVIEVEVGPGKTLAVDLSIFERRVKMELTAADDPWCAAAQAELPDFSARLEELGYNLQTSSFLVASAPTAPPGNRPHANWEA